MSVESLKKFDSSFNYQSHAVEEFSILRETNLKKLLDAVRRYGINNTPKWALIDLLKWYNEKGDDQMCKQIQKQLNILK